MGLYRTITRGLQLTTVLAVCNPLSVFAQSEPATTDEVAPEDGDVQTPDVETPDIETPDVETPDVEKPDVETPEVETPEVETPEVETPEVETFVPEVPTLHLLSADEVANAPAPENSSGVRVEESTGLDTNLLWVPRVIFYVPNQLLRLTFVPLQGLSYVWGRYRLPERFHDVFFNASGTFGIVPVFFLDTGFGFSAGARLSHSNLFGKNESLTLRASYGGRFEQLYNLALDSGQRFGQITLGLETGIERGGREPFYGIGNADETTYDSSMGPIDASDRSIAVRSRFKQNLSYIKAWSSYPLASDVKLKLSSEVRVQRFRDENHRNDNNTFDIFDPNSLVSLQEGTQDLYTQMQLSFDNRENVDRYVDTIMGPGLYAAAWLGYAQGFDGDPSNHFRYAVDLQGVINLWGGDRLLVLRALVDGVTAKLDEIPFADLPEIGGARLLRGYAGDRFRDRLHTLGTVEYQFNLSDKGTAFLFVDSGRVWRKWSDLEFEGLRTGYGGGIIVQTGASFVARAQLATSTDGGFFFNLAFDPMYQPQVTREAQP